MISLEYDKISMIRNIRKLYTMGLKEAKEWVESHSIEEYYGALHNGMDKLVSNKAYYELQEEYNKLRDTYTKLCNTVLPEELAAKNEEINRLQA